MSKTKNIPTSVFRLLLKNGITFQKVAAVVPYLEQLGIDGLSISSVFETNDAGGGRRSFDPTRLDEQSGGEHGFAVLDQALREANMALIVDVNPNQSPVSSKSLWWRDILEWGQESRYAAHFDIDWQDQITLPALERPLIEEVQAANLDIILDPSQGGLVMAYANELYPLSPKSYHIALEGIDSALANELRDAAAQATALQSDEFHEKLRTACNNSALKDRLEVATSLHRIVLDLNALENILSIQQWVLITEAAARRQMNYRHSYDSVYSAGIRVEDTTVFTDFHKSALELLETSQVTGFRINQIDGLSDPDSYLQQLRKETKNPIYLVTDKILLDSEQHSPSWQADGTAGYEYISAAANVLVDHDKLPILDRLYARTISDNPSRGTHYRNAKSAILHKKFAPELQALGNLLLSIAPDTPDELELRRLIGQEIIELPIFRTYAKSGAISDRYGSIFAVLGIVDATIPILLLTEFDRRFQQLSAAVMAQAIEQSYRYDQGPIAPDEITLRSSDASDPVQAFHRKMEEKAISTPQGMVATSFSYSTKFGEDARMRLLALSEAPEMWSEAVTRWRNYNATNIAIIEELPVPTPETEWLIYQTLAAIWPLTLHLDDQSALTAVRSDIEAFITKAIREARKEAFWTEINRPYELAIIDYIGHIFLDRTFQIDFTDTLRPYWVAAAMNSFSQTVLQMTTPGVPVAHVGSEMWDFSLSNMPSSEYLNAEAMAERLAYADRSPLNNLLADWHSGAIKHRLLARHLRLRKQHPALFLKGSYIPLKVTGNMAEHVVAFLRKHGADVCLVAVPRLSLDAVSKFQEPFMPIPAWEDTVLHLPIELNGMKFENILTGTAVNVGPELRIADAMRDFSTVTLISA